MGKSLRRRVCQLLIDISVYISYFEQLENESELFKVFLVFKPSGSLLFRVQPKDA